MARELELKYGLSQGQYDALLRDYPDCGKMEMETSYYDTPDGALSARHWTLRRRLENGVSVCTCKIPLPDGSRGEWEVEAEDIVAALPALAALGAPAELAQLRELRLHCGARFTRHYTAIHLPGGTAELALDEGVLLGGGQELPFREAELELKEGEDSVLLGLDQAFTEKYALTKEPKSKFARAKALAE